MYYTQIINLLIYLASLFNEVQLPWRQKEFAWLMINLIHHKYLRNCISKVKCFKATLSQNSPIITNLVSNSLWLARESSRSGTSSNTTYFNLFLLMSLIQAALLYHLIQMWFKSHCLFYKQTYRHLKYHPWPQMPYSGETLELKVKDNDHILPGNKKLLS